MQPSFAFLLAVMVALAGCSSSSGGDGRNDPSTKTTTTTTTTGGHNQTGNGTNNQSAENQPPSLSMQANASSPAPANVTFLLNGSDADGDNLTWMLDFGDNSTAATGTELPANVTHRYATAGIFNATFSVSDGKDTANVTVAINISAGSSFTKFVASGTAKLPCPQCTAAGANTGAGYRSGTNELDSYFVTIPASSPGQPFSVTSTGGNPDMVFRDSCSAGAAVGNAYTGPAGEQGTVPQGALCVLAWENAAASSRITVTIG
jgi:hypothetical protein